VTRSSPMGRVARNRPTGPAGSGESADPARLGVIRSVASVRFVVGWSYDASAALAIAVSWKPTPVRSAIVS